MPVLAVGPVTLTVSSALFNIGWCHNVKMAVCPHAMGVFLCDAAYCIVWQTVTNILEKCIISIIRRLLSWRWRQLFPLKHLYWHTGLYRVCCNSVISISIDPAHLCRNLRFEAYFSMMLPALCNRYYIAHTMALIMNWLVMNSGNWLFHVSAWIFPQAVGKYKKILILVLGRKFGELACLE